MAQILDLSSTYTQKEVEQAINSENEFESIEPGGYECKIVDAILNSEKKYIELDLDITEGKFEGYFQKLEDRAGFWGLKYFMSYKDTVKGKFFKTCTSINESNPNYNFNPLNGGGADVDSLIGKKIGVVVGLEEYKSKAGEIRTKAVVSNVKRIVDIANGKFKIPELKKLEESSNSNNEFMKLDPGASEDAPF